MSDCVYFLYRLQVFFLRIRLKPLAALILYASRIFFSGWIPGSATIGKGTKFGYGGLGVVIHNRAVIGDNCVIDQHVTIGGTSGHYEVPTIGSNVYMGAGSKILGPITIGSNVVIGANSVVIKSIPDDCLVVGAPARVVRTGIQMRDYV